MNGTVADDARFDQLLTAQQRADGLTWRNAHLVQYHPLEELLFEARRRFKDPDGGPTVRVVSARMPSFDTTGWVEGFEGKSEMFDTFSDPGHDPADTVVPTEGQCVFHWAPFGTRKSAFGPVRVLWVAMAPLIVQFEFCNDCATFMETSFGPLDWRNPNG